MSLHGSPVQLSPARREREDDPFQGENSQTQNQAPPHLPLSTKNIYIDAIQDDVNKRKKKKKAAEEVEADPKPDKKHSPKEAAERDYKAETAELLEQQKQYDLHLSNLRHAYLEQSSAFMRQETPRVTKAVASEEYGDVIEDKDLHTEIKDRARKHAETLCIKYRSARGIQHQRNDAEMSQNAIEKVMHRLGKQMQQLLTVTEDLLRLSEDTGDSIARTTYMTQVGPQWSLFYDMMTDRAEQWIFYAFLIELLDNSIRTFKEQSTKQKIKLEMDALDVAESDLEASSSSEDDDDEEDDDDSDETVDGSDDDE